MLLLDSQQTSHRIYDVSRKTPLLAGFQQTGPNRAILNAITSWHS
jgi:hypothetical protein